MEHVLQDRCLSGSLCVEKHPKITVVGYQPQAIVFGIDVLMMDCNLACSLSTFYVRKSILKHSTHLQFASECTGLVPIAVQSRHVYLSSGSVGKCMPC